MNMREWLLGCVTLLLCVGMVCNAWREVARESERAKGGK